MKNTIILIFIFTLLFGTLGCTSFLDVKSDSKLAVPTSLEDYRALMNSINDILAVPEGEVMSVDHYLPDDEYDALFCQTDRDLYRLEDSPMIQECDGSGGWALAYGNIYRANVAIHGVEDFEKANGISARSADVKGQGYFNRAINLYELALVWCAGFDPQQGESTLGLPLKVTDDFNEKTVRASLKATFDLIVDDLQKAATLLPDQQNNIYWASKVAAWAYLARVYLFMQDYEQAKAYAEKCINSSFKLLDYHHVDGGKAFPFKVEGNPEVIYPRFLSTAYYSISLKVSRMDSVLFQGYEEDDLRKTLFFNQNNSGLFFRGDYGGGGGGSFCGPTIAEMYLIQAECAARIGKLNEASNTLQKFLSYRLKKARSFAEKEVLDQILQERRKELLRRGIRFGDVKRLNKLGAGISLKRTIRGKEYILPPNDSHANILIPQKVIEQSGIVQNPR